MIRIKGLKKRFGKKRVLDGITLTLNDQNSWLLGPNGSGKTTLFRIILGLLPSDAGTIKVAGKEGKKPNIGYLPQHFGPFPHLTVEEQMQYFARLKEEKRDGINWDAEVERAIRLAHLEGERRKKCRTLSGGMVRRLGIAQAIMEDPEVILLDEPMNGLDNQGVEDIRKVLLSLRDKGKTILLASHSKEDIAVLCDTVTEMESGKAKR